MLWLNHLAQSLRSKGTAAARWQVVYVTGSTSKASRMQHRFQRRGIPALFEGDHHHRVQECRFAPGEQIEVQVPASKVALALRVLENLSGSPHSAPQPR